MGEVVFAILYFTISRVLRQKLLAVALNTYRKVAIEIAAPNMKLYIKLFTNI
jgi:hypothetical protein